MPSSSKPHVCPVCGYAGLEEAAYDEQNCASFEICPSCGTEFGYQDATRSHADLRSAWVQNGMRWASRSVGAPPNWDPVAQLGDLEQG
jgi:predicted RNA-binding Zn-ribbon protein involved in translation (DUF1610 family)